MDWLASLGSVFSPAFISLLVAAGVGLIIGLEREFNTRDEPAHLGGIRTFILVAMLGHVSDWLSKIAAIGWTITAMSGFILLVALAYFAQTQKGKLGLTTPLALLLTFLLGVAIAEGQMQESLAVVVLTTVVLSLKEQLHSFIRQITTEELFAFLKFIVLALLILPMLPDRPFGPDNLITPKDLGVIAVLVLSISFTGYLLLKFGSPQKGILLTAVIGGLFSSTLIAWVFSAKSRERIDLARFYGSGIVLASSIMFVRVFAWAALFAPQVARQLSAPLAMMLLVSLIPSWAALRERKKSGDAPPLSPGNPLDVKNAVFFVLLYIGITWLMTASRQWLSPAMTYLSGAAAGIADIDAISISTAKWAVSPSGVTREASIIIILAVISNSLFKWLVSVFNGNHALRRPVGIGFGLVSLVGMGWIIFWFL